MKNLRLERLQRYGAKFGGNKFSAFYGLHRFEFGGMTVISVHFWPFVLSWEVGK
jgi:hypothetical protein